MLKSLVTKSKGFSAEIRRSGWALFAALVGGFFISEAGREIFRQQFGVLAWKLVLVGVATFLAHTFRSQMFPYLDLKTVLYKSQGTGGAVAAGLIFLGICLLNAAIILAICAGL